MERTWKRLSDRREVSLEAYIKEWMLNNPGYRIYIGCDSQNHGNITLYAIVIVLHYPKGGAHVIYTEQTLPRVRTKKPDDDMFIRLWQEVEYSIETAKLLISSGIGKPDFVDIDLNPDPIYKSNSLLRAALGLVEGIGIESRWKHNSAWAISIADSICNPKKTRNSRRNKKSSKKN